MHVLQSLLLISDKLSTRSDNLLGMNLQLSINFILYVIVSPLSLSCSFLIGTEKPIYFSVLHLSTHRSLYKNCNQMNKLNLMNNRMVHV